MMTLFSFFRRTATAAFTVTAKAGPGQIRLTWANPPAGVRGYEILWRLGSEPWSTALVNERTAKYTIIGLSPGLVYTGQVIPLVGSSVSRWTANPAPIVAFYPTAIPSVSPPSDLAPTVI